LNAALEATKNARLSEAKESQGNQPFNADPMCVICLDIIEDARMTKCRHQFCGQCVSSALEVNHECPLCRAPSMKKDLKPPPPPPISAEQVQAEMKEHEDRAQALSASIHSAPQQIQFTSK